MAYDFNNGDTELLLLGDKSYRPKAFTLKEIMDANYKDGYYKEGIQPEDVTFRLDITTKDFRYNTTAAGPLVQYHVFGQIIVWETDNKIITNYNLDYANCYLNNGNNSLDIPNCRFIKDVNGNRYELIGKRGHHNSASIGYLKAGGSFGPPMSTGSTYPQCREWLPTDSKDLNSPVSYYIQTDNPKIKAMAITFTAAPAWSGSSAYLYSSCKLYINGETIYEYDAMGDFTRDNYLPTVGITPRFIPRFVIVKNDDTYKVYKTWMKFENVNNVISTDLYLIGETFREAKVVTLDELIANGRTDGLYDDTADSKFTLRLAITQMWATYYNCIFPSGALVWDEASNVIGPYTRVGHMTSGEIIEIINGNYTDTDTDPLDINLKYDKNPYGGDTNFLLSSCFGKNIQIKNGWTNAAVGSIITTGGIGNTLNALFCFYDKIKAFGIDTSSIYDIKYNGINQTQNRHCGKLESITHNVILHNANNVKEFNEEYIVTVNNKIYGPRCIFTKDDAFIVFSVITDTKNLEVSPKLYVYHGMTNEVIEYTIDEVIEMNKTGRIIEGRYNYTVVPVVDTFINLTKTFNTTNNKIGFKSIKFLDSTNNAISGIVKLVGNLFRKDDRIYEFSPSNKPTDGRVNETINTTNNGLLFNGDTPTKIVIKSDNPDINVISLIPWYDTINVNDNDETEQNFIGKLEIGNNVVYNYTTEASYLSGEFKRIEYTEYGSIYFYNVKNNTLKKAWIKLNGNYTKYYILYQNNTESIMLSKSIEQIFELTTNNGIVTVDVIPIPLADKFSLQIISGGQYGGAYYRLYPVINNKVYYLETPVTFANTASGTINVKFKYTGKTVSDMESLNTFVQGCNTQAYFEDIESDEEISISLTWSGRYTNGTIYNPQYCFYNSGSYGHNYFLGSATNVTRKITCTVTGHNISGFDSNNIVKGLILIPYHSANTSGRCATSFRFELLDNTNSLHLANVTANKYKGWYMDTIDNLTEATNP